MTEQDWSGDFARLRDAIERVDIDAAKRITNEVDDRLERLEADGQSDVRAQFAQSQGHDEWISMMAEIDLVIAMVECKVPKDMARRVMTCRSVMKDGEWEDLDTQVSVVAEKRGDSVRSPAHRRAYLKAAVTLAALSDEVGKRVDADTFATLEKAAQQYYDAHFERADDYAPGKTVLLDRVLHGAQCIDHMPEGRALRFWADIDVFKERVSRHEYTAADLRAVIAALNSSDEKLSGEIAGMAERLASLQRVARIYEAGPAHLVALEQQWLAMQIASRAVARGGMSQPALASLVDYTVGALREAVAYCWAPTCVEAVASAGKSMPGEFSLSDEALGIMGRPGTCGWWWFQEPVPVQTTEDPRQHACAMVWRRAAANEKSGVWFQLFTLQAADHRGRKVLAPIPTTGFTWYYGTSLAELPSGLEQKYENVYGEGKAYAHNFQAGRDVTVAASVWFARFYLAGAAWLRQRVLTVAPGEGTRQVRRQIQREHKLREAPQVQVVHLRRRDYRRATEHLPGDPDAPKRTYRVQWMVEGFWRNQWYASSGTHAPKWIDSFLKGPSGAPMKTTARVYAVNR